MLPFNPYLSFMPIGSWTPMTPATPLLWLKADTGVSLSGSSVTGWADQSGHGYNFIPSTGANPSYSATGWNSSKPAIQFGPGYTDMFNQSAGLANLSAGWRVRIYVTLNVPTNAGVVQYFNWQFFNGGVGGVGAYQIEINNNVDQITYSSGGVTLTGNSMSGNITMSYSLNHPGDGYSYSWINGISSIVNTNPVPTTTTDIVVLGGNKLNHTHQFTGTIAEIVVYDITSQDVDVLAAYNSYALFKWGGLFTGLSTTPSWHAAGTNSNAFSNPTPAYPTNTAGDLFLMDVYCNSGSASTPSGWTLISSSTDGVITIYVFSRNTRATGSDSGTVAVTGTGSPIQANIQSISNVATSSFTEGVTTATGSSSTFNMPTVVTSGTHRLVCAFSGINNTGPMSAGSGQTGGTWIERSEDNSGLGADHQLQTAAMDSGGTISGGTATFTGASRVVCVAFALLGV